MSAALGWGALAASSLVIGALIALARPWPDVAVGLVLAFGAGALISAVSFDLAEEGVATRPGRPPSASGSPRAPSPTSSPTARCRRATRAPALTLGAFLDGIPEQLVLGIGLAAGDGVSVGLLAAIFVSNLPEAIGSASGLHAPPRKVDRAVGRRGGDLHARDRGRLRARGQRLSESSRAPRTASPRARCS